MFCWCCCWCFRVDWRCNVVIKFLKNPAKISLTDETCDECQSTILDVQFKVYTTGSTQPCIPPWSLNWVPASIGWGKGGNVTSTGWQVTLCDPIWHATSHSSEACCKLPYSIYLYLYTHIHGQFPGEWGLRLFYITVIEQKERKMRWHFSGQRWEWLDGCVAWSFKIEFQVTGWERD